MGDFTTNLAEHIVRRKSGELTANFMMIENQIDFISNIQDDSIYRKYEKSVYTQMGERAGAVLSKFRQVSTKQSEFALALFGSYGRGEPSPVSDLDILHISKSGIMSPKLATKIKTGFSDYTINIQKYPLIANQEALDTLSLWLIISNMRYAAGNEQLYRLFLTTLVTKLATFPLDNVLKLFANELDHTARLSHLSPHFYNIKRGAGGILEYEFVRVLQLWQVARGDPPSIQQQYHLELIRNCFSYIILLKEFIGRIYGEPTESYNVPESTFSEGLKDYWFFRPKCAEQIFIICHSHVMQYIALVPP